MHLWHIVLGAALIMMGIALNIYRSMRISDKSIQMETVGGENRPSLDRQ
jgi:hypothetical protein